MEMIVIKELYNCESDVVRKLVSMSKLLVQRPPCRERWEEVARCGPARQRLLMMVGTARANNTMIASEE